MNSAQGARTPTSHGFHRLLKESIDEALLVVGASTKDIIYRFLETRHHLEPNQIPDRLETFQNALRELYGRGATPLEKHIAKTLYGKLNLTFRTREGWTLVDYVNHAKRCPGRFRKNTRGPRSTSGSARVYAKPP